MQTIPTSMRASATVGKDTKLGEICWYDSSTGLSGEIAIRSPKCTIGSHPSSTIVLPENIAAATHLTLTFGKRFTLLKAPYPTRIKGRLVREWLIDEPIEFCIGTCLFQLVPSAVAFKASSVVRAHQLVATANKMSVPLPSQPASQPVPAESSPMELESGVESEERRELSVSDFERTLSRFDSIESSLDQLRSSLGQIQEAVDKVPIDSLNVSKSLAEEFSQLSQNLTLQISTELRSQFEQRLDEQGGVWNDALKDGVHLLESRIENLALKVESLGEMQGNLEETAMNAEIRQSTSMEHRFAGIESRLDEFANRLVEASEARNSEAADSSGEVWKAEFESRFQELRSQRDEIYHALESVRNDVQQFGSVAQCNFEYLLQQLQAIPREGQLPPTTENEYQNSGSAAETSAYSAYANESYANESYTSPEYSPYREELPVNGSEGSLSEPSLDAYQESLEYSPESQSPSESENQSYYAEDRPYAVDDYAFDNAVRVDEPIHGVGTPADLEVGEYIDSLSHSVAEKYQNESLVYPDSDSARDSEPERDSFLRPDLDAYDGGYDYASRLADSEQQDEPEAISGAEYLVDDQSSNDPEVDIEALSARLRRMLSHPGGRSEANDPNRSGDNSLNSTTQERRSEPFSGFGSEASNVWTGGSGAASESLVERESLREQPDAQREFSREDLPPSNASSQKSMLEQFLRENSDSLPVDNDSYSYLKPGYGEPPLQENSLREAQAFDASDEDDRYDVDQGVISRVDELADSIDESSQELLDQVPLRQAERSKPSATMVESGSEPSQPAEDEDSIEAYMQKLLQRVKSGPDSTGIPVVSTQTDSKNAPRSRSEILNRSSRDITAAPSAAPATEPAIAPKSSMMTAEEFVPRQQAPEKKNELDALRELANSNARRAITRSESKRMSSAILLKVAITAFALAAAVTLLAINGLNINPPFAGMVAALIVAFLWGYDCLKHFRMLGSVKASETKENDRTSALQQRSTQEQWRPKAD